MAAAVPDQVVRDIVGDHTRSRVAVPSPAPQKSAGNGWQELTPLEPPPGQKHIEAIAAHFDRLDRQRGDV
jgi:hypothetical protein